MFDFEKWRNIGAKSFTVTDVTMLHNLHITHSSDAYMIMNARNKICWPSMKADIKEFYKNCSEYLEFKRSKAQVSTEISYETSLNILSRVSKYNVISPNTGKKITC